MVGKLESGSASRAWDQLVGGSGLTLANGCREAQQAPPVDGGRAPGAPGATCTDAGARPAGGTRGG